MSDDDRIARLEARVQVLESLVRQVLAGARRPGDTAPREAAGPPAPPPARPPLSEAPTPAAVAAEAAAPPPRPAARQPSRRVPSVEFRVSEQWLGQKGLLTIGVIFVILAAGYLLKLSFDRGWISPLARCVGGALAGVGVGAIGWRLHGRGLRVYGASLLGTGGAIVYLAVWAAAQLYQFLEPTQAVIGLALVSLSLAAVAWAVNVQALLAAAALGAFFAPIVIGEKAGTANLLLAYLGTMGAALGWVAATRRWRLAMGVITAAYFWLSIVAAAGEASAWPLWSYAILGGAAGLYVGLREGWFETRFLAFAGGWTLLGAADSHALQHWPNLLGGAVLSAPVWWRAFRSDTIWPAAPATGAGTVLEQLRSRRVSFGETFYFYVTPILLTAALWSVAREWFRAHPGLAAALIALPYLAAGYERVRRPFALAAAGLLATAALQQTNDLHSVWLLLGLAHLWALADHLFKRSDGRWYALATFAVAAYHLATVVVPMRAAEDAAFVSLHALTLWFTVETAVVLALGLIREDAPVGELSIKSLLWGAGGVILFLGVSGELTRLFELSGMDPAGARLAGGLAVSAWWIVFAAACFAVGFQRRLRQLRFTGFFVAGLAVLKVVFVDLSTLDALYRVGSALILGLASLGIAYAYHRRAPE